MPQKKNTAVFLLFSALGVIAAAYVGAALAVELLAQGGSLTKLLSSTPSFAPDAVIDGFTENVPNVRAWAGYGAFVAAIVAACFYNPKRLHKRGSEHGSARWATNSEKKVLADKGKKTETITAKTWTDKKGNPVLFKADNNIILANDVFLSLNTRQHMKNTHVLIVGGSGAGKTRFFGKPNIMQLNTSYVVTDPKGELLRSLGTLLEQAGYKIKVFSLINMANSHNYNPFEYVRDASGKISIPAVIKMVDVFMKNTKDGGDKASDDPFWDNAAKLLISSIVFLLLEEGKKEEQNFATVAKKLMKIKINIKDPNAKHELDKEFDEIAELNPTSQSLKYYRAFKIAAGETAQSIIINCNVRLQAFMLPEVEDLTHCDTLNLSRVGDCKTALFVLISDSDATFNFLAAMMYTQMFDALYSRADFHFGGRLPVHVRCILDEFANIGVIPNFDKLIATMRSREISVNVIVQSLAQIKSMYEKTHEVISDNCDSFLFLGSQGTTTLEEISKKLGKETIDVSGKNRTKGAKNNSTSEQNSILGRELMQIDELARLNKLCCIATVRGSRPFFSYKYRIKRHRHYKYLDDVNPQYAYDWRDVITEKAPAALSENERAALYFETVGDVAERENETETEVKETETVAVNAELVVKIADSIAGLAQKRMSYGTEEVTSEVCATDEPQTEIVADYADDFTETADSTPQYKKQFVSGAEFDDTDIADVFGNEFSVTLNGAYVTETAPDAESFYRNEKENISKNFALETFIPAQVYDDFSAFPASIPEFGFYDEVV